MDPIITAPPSGRSEGRRRLWATRPTGLPVLVAGALLALGGILAGCSSNGAPSFSGPAAQPSPSASTSAAPTASPTPPPTPSPRPAFPTTLTDDEGGTVTLAAAPTRIISLTPGTTETLFALGAGPNVVAVTDFDDYPDAVKTLPHVASFSAIDIEKVVALAPDLILAGGNGFNPPDQIAKLRALGLQVLVVYARDVPGVLKDIQLVGTAIGKADAAKDLTASMQASFDQIHAAAASLPAPRTFYEIDTTGAIYGPADQSFIAGMITLAGGTPITTGDPNKFDIPLEKLVTADPEVIVLGDAAYGATPAIVKARPGWGTMTAVKTGAIRAADDIVITRPGPRLADGLRSLAIAIHPELASVLASPSPSGVGSPVPSASGSGAP
jgi:iron complex transport system substrate-binding protein